MSIFIPGFRVSILLSSSAIFLLFEIWKKPAKNCPIFFIGIDRLGPYPTSNKSKAEKNSQVACFANLSEDERQQILAERHSLGTKEVTNWSLLFLNLFNLKNKVVNWQFTKNKTITIAKRLLRADPCCRSVCYKRICSCF